MVSECDGGDLLRADDLYVLGVHELVIIDVEDKGFDSSV